MSRNRFVSKFLSSRDVLSGYFLIKWFIIALVISVPIGISSAFFLWSLAGVTEFRTAHLWIVAGLPLAGLLIGWLYQRYGTSVLRGNNQLLESYYAPAQAIPFRMAPLVLIGTLITHLFGGSAGREGTAVQMAGAIADRVYAWIPLSKLERRLLLLMGISGGFAAVFGTPWAGAFFALEVVVIGRYRWWALPFLLIVAYTSDWVCHATGVGHISYFIDDFFSFSVVDLSSVFLASVAFGIMGAVFAWACHFWAEFFKGLVSKAMWRPFVGGVFIALSVWMMGTDRYIGLGIPTIIESFEGPLPWYDFIVKTLTTSFTLGAGFKGGEVTPLFFVGATMGNALSQFFTTPLPLLVASGFVGVFSGATKTPIACTLMGMELFGAQHGLWLALACWVAYWASGQTGIYGAQRFYKRAILFGKMRFGL
ncbi:chloride channel protein [Penaeicola halotolerans]|uniref:chloride channel protein n=1 Tax=Penaeicola halotolerans TaxID=2793196 RepID=UPI001CF8348E|nr:chloride channel protein [Penaeicola halotolerans]